MAGLSEPHQGHTLDERWLARVRIGVLAAGFAIVGVAAGGIFDRPDWTLVVGPLVPAMVAALLVGRPSLARIAGAATSGVAFRREGTVVGR